MKQHSVIIAISSADGPAPPNTFAALADALVRMAVPELDAALAIAHTTRHQRSRTYYHESEIDRLRRQIADAEQRRRA